MHPIKFLWAIRALAYKPFFKRIGRLTYIGKPCFISGKKNISLGEKTRIFPGCRMEALESGEIIIGDNCAIEQNFHIVSKNNQLYIGDDTTISANVFISNVNHGYSNINKSVMDQELNVEDTIIGNSCFIGYGSCILPGTKLGNHCIIGSNSVIKGIYPDNCVIVGSPGKVVKVFNMEKKEWIKK